MAWALQFDGVNDYLTLDFPLQNDDIVDLTFISTGAVQNGDYVFDGSLSNNRCYLYCRDDTGKLDWSSANYKTVKLDGVSISKASTNLPSDTAEHTLTCTMNGSSTLGRIGARFTDVSTINFKVKTLIVTRAGGEVLNLDATASDHSNTGSQPVMVDTVGSNDATGVNMPTDGSAWKAIFPDAYTLLVEYDLPTITGTHTYFVALLKYDDFNVGDALDFWDNGGGDLRISDDINGTTQLPIEVVEFDKVGLSAQVWVKIPSAFTGKTIYLWGDNTGDSQPAVTDAYGRNAVYSNRRFNFKQEDNTDSTGNQDATTQGTVATVAGQVGNAKDYNGSDSATVIADNASLDWGTNDFTVSAWVKPNSSLSTSSGGRIVNTAGKGSLSSKTGFQLKVVRSGSNWGFNDCTVTDSTGDKIRLASTFGSYPVDVWAKVTMVYEQSTQSFKLYKDNALATTVSGDLLGSIDSPNDLVIGASLYTNNEPSAIDQVFGGAIDEVYGETVARDLNFIATEYDNQSTVGAWGTPTRVGGGGATYTINIDNLASTGSFTDLSLLHNKKLNLDAISATANFDNVDLHYNRKLQLNALAATGQFETVALRHNRKLNLDTLTASGQFEDVTLDYNQGYSLTLGTLAATGGFDDVSLRHNRKLNLDTLSATGQFQAVTLNYTPSSVTYTLALDTLAATANFDDVSLRHNRKLNIEPIVATAYFDDVALLKGHKLNLNSLSSTATFNDVELLHNRVLSLEPMTAGANFQAIALNWSGFVEQRITNFSMRYKDNPVKASYKAQPFTIKFKE